MKFLALIPARWASTRFPGKPLADIGGRSMIEHVFSRCSTVFEHCYVATDDDRIASAVRGFAGKVVMTSTEHRSGTDRCREALLKVEKQTGMTFDVVVNIQGDEPFMAPRQLEQIKGCFDSKTVDIATLIKKFTDQEDVFSANSPKVVVSKAGYALYFSRSVVPYLRGEDPESWQAKHVYYKHIGLYAYRREVLLEVTELPASALEIAESLEQLRWLENGYRIKTAITDQESYAIDTPQDLEKARELMFLQTVL